MELLLLIIGYGLYKTSWSSCCAVPELVLILRCKTVSIIGVVEVACCLRFDQRSMFRFVGRSDHSDRLRRANLVGYREDCLYFVMPVHLYARESGAGGDLDMLLPDLQGTHGWTGPFCPMETWRGCACKCQRSSFVVFWRSIRTPTDNGRPQTCG